MKACVGGHYGACTGEVLPKAESCTLAGDEDCNGLSCSEVAWTRNGGNGGDVTVDPSGNVYWVGAFSGTITIGGTTLVAAGKRLTPKAAAPAALRRKSLRETPSLCS